MADASDAHEELTSPDPQFEPIIKLPEVEIKTLEEDEDELLRLRAKLFRFDSEADPQEWKERGTGDIKFLKHKEKGHIRVLMRRDKTLKVCANHFGKVRGFILCAECGKRRAVYSKQRLSGIQHLALERVQEELIYTCGNPLFPEGDPNRDIIVVREGLLCSSTMETTYYAVLPNMSLTPKSGNPKAWVWSTPADYTDNEAKAEMLAIRFGSVENAQKFKTAFDDAREKMGGVLGECKDGEKDDTKEKSGENNSTEEKKCAETNGTAEKEEDSVTEKLGELTVKDKSETTPAKGGTGDGSEVKSDPSSPTEKSPTKV